MYRFFCYFLAPGDAEQAAESMRAGGFAIWDIQSGWDDPFTRLEVRRQVAAGDLAAAIDLLRAIAGQFGGEYSDAELCA
jgi:hypothetical protein